MSKAYQIRNQDGIYFLTFQVVGWADIFTRSKYRDIIIDTMEYCRKHKGLFVFSYVIMSNHVHVIWKSKNGTLSNIVRDFKRRTARLIIQEVKDNPIESRRDWLLIVFKYHAKFNKRNSNMQFWTHENHAVELNETYLVDQRINYIHENPVRARLVDRVEEYVYSSAKNFAGEDAMMEIDII